MHKNERPAIAHYQRKHAIADTDPVDATAAEGGFAILAANETRLRTIETLGIAACTDLRIRGRWHLLLPITPTFWSAGDLEDLVGGEP